MKKRVVPWLALPVSPTDLLHGVRRRFRRSRATSARPIQEPLWSALPPSIYPMPADWGGIARPASPAGWQQEVILPYFEAIHIIGGQADIVLQQSHRSSLLWRGSDKEHELCFDCKEGQLCILMKSKTRYSKWLQLCISTPQISALKIEGASQLRSRNTIRTEALSVVHQGTGVLRLSLTSNRLQTVCQCTGSLHLQGRTNYWRDDSLTDAEVNAGALLVTVP